jgi:hypothetical protein
VSYWKDIFDRCQRGQESTVWDYHWLFANWSQGYVSCVPNVNLVSNIGFEGVHFQEINPVLHDRPAMEIAFPLRHPTSVIAADKYDSWIDQNIFYTARSAARRFIQNMPLGGFLWRQMAKMYRRIAS